MIASHNCVQLFRLASVMAFLALSCAVRRNHEGALACMEFERNAHSSPTESLVTEGMATEAPNQHHFTSSTFEERFHAFVDGLPSSRRHNKYEGFLGQSHPAFGEFGDFSFGDPMFYFPDDKERCIGDPKSYTCAGEDCACALGASPAAVPVKFWAYRFAGKDDFTLYGLRNRNAGDLRWATSAFGELCEDRTIPVLNTEDNSSAPIYLAIYEMTVISGFGVEAHSYGACNDGRCGPADPKYDDPSRPIDFVKVGWQRVVFDEDSTDGCLWFSFRAETQEQRSGWSTRQLFNARMTDVCAGARRAFGVGNLYTVSESSVADYLAFLVAQASHADA